MGELLCKDPLFQGKTEIDQIDRIFRLLGTPNEKIWPNFINLPSVRKIKFPHQPYNNLRKKFPKISPNGGVTLSDAGFDLLNKLLAYDPSRRRRARRRWGTSSFASFRPPRRRSSCRRTRVRRRGRRGRLWSGRRPRRGRETPNSLRWRRSRGRIPRDPAAAGGGDGRSRAHRAVLPPQLETRMNMIQNFRLPLNLMLLPGQAPPDVQLASPGSQRRGHRTSLLRQSPQLVHPLRRLRPGPADEVDGGDAGDPSNARAPGCAREGGQTRGAPLVPSRDVLERQPRERQPRRHVPRHERRGRLLAPDERGDEELHRLRVLVRAPIFLGRSVRIVCPRTVAAVAPPAPDAVTSYRLTCAPSTFGPAASLDAHLKRDEPRASR